MAPKKMLITPEKTAEADEKKAAAEAAEAAEEKELQEHYEHAESLLSAAEKDPEKVKAAGEKIGVDYSVLADHATAIKGGIKKFLGKPVSEEEDSAYAEKRSFLKKILDAKIRKDFQEKSPEERAKSVKMMTKLMRRRDRESREKALKDLNRVDPEFHEKVLKELNRVDSDAPSEADEENA